MRNGLIITDVGEKFWYKKGLLDREDGPAAIYSFGEYWYKKGLLHRLNGPAVIEYSWHKWYKEGKLHRENGPAIEYRDCFYKNSYYYEGKLIECYSTEEFLKIIKLNYLFCQKMKFNPPDSLKAFSCPLCNVELFFLSKRKVLFSSTIFTTIDNTPFTVHINYLEKYTIICKLIGITEDDVVVEFNSILDISPLNVNDKLKTILTFM
jgi:hypothetical protein